MNINSAFVSIPGFDPGTPMGAETFAEVAARLGIEHMEIGEQVVDPVALLEACAIDGKADEEFLRTLPAKGIILRDASERERRAYGLGENAKTIVTREADGTITTTHLV